MTGVRYLTARRTASSGGLEAVRRGLGRHDGQRRLAVAAVHGVEEVGLLGLGGEAGGGSAPLDVDDQERQLEADGQAHGLRLEVDARARRGGHPQRAAEGRAQGGADAGDLVLGLEGPHPELLVLGQLVEDVRGRGDRVGAEEQRAARCGWRRRSGPRPWPCCR